MRLDLREINIIPQHPIHEGPPRSIKPHIQK